MYYTRIHLIILAIITVVHVHMLAERLILPAIILGDHAGAAIDTLQSCGTLIDDGVIICGNATSSAGRECIEYLTKHHSQYMWEEYAGNFCAEAWTQVLQRANTMRTAIFCLVLKAGWRLRSLDQLVSWCTTHDTDTCDVYNLRVVPASDKEDWYEPCLCRCKEPLHFEGIYHIRPATRVTLQNMPREISAIWEESRLGVNHTYQGYMRDRAQLEAHHQRTPHAPGILFSLAENYALTGDLVKAQALYMQRASLHGDPEEDYLAVYRMAESLDNVVAQEQEAAKLQRELYLKAHAMRPWRAEPLVRLAQKSLEGGNKHVAFLFAQEAAALPYPLLDRLAIDRAAYDYASHDIVGITAWYLGEYDLGEEALTKVYSKNPQDQRLAGNLAFYRSRAAHGAKPVSHRDHRVPAAFGAPFDESMELELGPAYNKKTFDEDSVWCMLRNEYKRIIIDDLEYAEKPRIPKVIHQIWIGGDIPVRYRDWQVSWKAMNPDWEYKLWTTKDIEALGLVNQHAYEAAPNNAERADIARYEILYRFGGLYADTDFECLKPMDVFHHCCDFYACLEVILTVGNSLIGCAAGDPIIKRCINMIEPAKPGESHWQQTCARTGPGLLTRAIRAEFTDPARTSNRSVVFPSGYFFPWYPLYGQPRPTGNVLRSLKPETFAIHMWDSSWPTP